MLLVQKRSRFGDDGLAIDDEAGRNFVIGNVLSGNFSDGVEIQAAGATEIIVAGNYIGTDATGTQALGNGTDGVDIDAGATNNIITRNVIASNGETGIELNDEGTSNNIITSNYIGTDATGTLELGNAEDGIIIFEGASGNIVGNSDLAEPITYNFAENEILQRADRFLTTSSRQLLKDDSLINEGNIISNNGGAGVLIAGITSTGNTISGNSISDNAGLGIDLGNDLTRDGVTVNDSGDIDTGANNLLNSPEIDSIFNTANGTKLAGTLVSLPNTSYRLDFYSSPIADPSGFGEGQNFLGSIDIETDENGNGDFVFSVEDTLPATQVVSATTTNLETGDTSEFSSGVFVG